MNAADYRPHTRRSPLTDPWEPLLAKETPEGVNLAVEIREAHCNSRGLAHGGLLSALADNAMGLSVVTRSRTRPGAESASAVTVALTIDFIDSARVGDFIEIWPAVLKVGRTLAFVECRVICGERLLARGSATFRIVG